MKDEWSSQQLQALDLVFKWMRNPRSRVFKLFGLAGTGKTTLLREAARAARRPAYMAPTGKAALRMRMAGCAGAGTIHSALYSPVEEPDGTLSWTMRSELATDNSDLVVLDEGSQVGPRVGRDLLDVSRKLLVVADPMQLPPVEGDGYFMANPDVELTEIHRQAADNPIIQLSMQLRQGASLREGQYGESLIASRYDLPKRWYLDHDIILCGRNKTRHRINNEARQARGWDNPTGIQVGDRLVCRRNNNEKGFLNGSMWDVTGADYFKRGTRWKLQLRSADDPDDRHRYETDVPVEFFEGLEDGLRRDYRAKYDEFAYGYCLTVHTSQGSQWGSVGVIDESSVFGEHAARWSYTAVTRAAERVTVGL